MSRRGADDAHIERAISRVRAFVERPEIQEQIRTGIATVEAAKVFTGEDDIRVIIHRLIGETGVSSADLASMKFWELFEQAIGKRRGNTEAMKAALAAFATTDATSGNDPIASPDFSSITYHTKTYLFSAGQQRKIVAALWKARPNGLSEKAIATAAGSNATPFRMVKTFRGGQNETHPALVDKLIDRVGVATWAIAPHAG